MFYRTPYSFRFLMLDGSLSLWPELTNVHTEGKIVKIYWYAESKVFRVKKSREATFNVLKTAIANRGPQICSEHNCYFKFND